MALKILPDVEALAIDYLKDQADVAALCGGRVYSRIPVDSPVFPLVIVTLPIPTEDPAPPHLEAGIVDLSCWGRLTTEDVTAGQAKAAVRDLAATVYAALWDPAFTGVRPGLGVVTGVETRVGIQWSPDPNTDRPRYILQVAIYAHPET